MCTGCTALARMSAFSITMTFSPMTIGDPMRLLPAADAEDISAAREELDFPGYVFGLDRSAPDYMTQLTERYGAALARHAADRRVD